MSTTIITNDIQVSVSTQYKPSYSNPLEQKYFHCYEVTITNHNDFPVQLQTRKWLIKESSGKKTIVNGEGVVGKTPILYPGESFEYISGCLLESPVGKMEGHYQFIRLDSEEEFYSTIPSFKLISPTILN